MPEAAAIERRDGWYGRLAGEDTSSGFPLNAFSGGVANQQVVKSGAGVLYGFTVYNSNVAAQFVLLFDATAIPAAGAVPNIPYTVPGSSNLSVFFGDVGRACVRGIVLVNSTTFATYTADAADCWFDAQYV